MSLLSAIILSTFNYEYFFITKNPEFPTQAVDFPPARMSPGKGTEPAGHTSCIAAENDSLPPMCCRLQPAARVGKERVVQRIVLRCVFKWYNVQRSSNADCSVQEVKKCAA